MQIQRWGVALVLAVVLPACGGGSSSSSPSAPTAVATPVPVARSIVTVVVSPNPIVAGPGAQGFLFSANFTVAIAETAGLACNLNLINVTLRNATTGVELNTITFNVNDIIARSGGNFVAANGTRSVPLGINYTLSGGGRQAAVTVAVQAIDGRGNTINASSQLNLVRHADGPIEP